MPNNGRKRHQDAGQNPFVQILGKPIKVELYSEEAVKELVGNGPQPLHRQTDTPSTLQTSKLADFVASSLANFYKVFQSILKFDGASYC